MFFSFFFTVFFKLKVVFLFLSLYPDNDELPGCGALVYQFEVKLMNKVTKGQILEILSPMYNVILDVDRNGIVAVIKDDIKFAIIKDEAICLINQQGEFKKVAHDIVANTDHLLQEATKAFWCACSLESEA